MFVFPDSNRYPALRVQSSVSVDIPLPIALDLVRPIPPVGCVNLVGMIRAAMPEAAVYEDGDPEPREDNVCLTS